MFEVWIDRMNQKGFEYEGNDKKMHHSYFFYVNEDIKDNLII